MVPEVTDPHVLIHVGVIKVLPEPADVTPVEIPLPFTAGGGNKGHGLSRAGGSGPQGGDPELDRARPFQMRVPTTPSGPRQPASLTWSCDLPGRWKHLCFHPQPTLPSSAVR